MESNIVYQLLHKFPECMVEGKLGLFRHQQLERFKQQLDKPEDGVTGFLMQVPGDIYDRIVKAQFKSAVDDRDMEYALLSALPDDIQPAVLLLIDRKKMSRPPTPSHVTVYGTLDKNMQYSLHLSERILMAERVDEASIASDFSASIFSYGDLCRIIDEIMDGSERVRMMIKAQLFGAPPNPQSGLKGTFTTIYPSGLGVSFAGSQQDFLMNFLEDLHYPFCLDKNYNKRQSFKSWFWKRKTVELKTPITDFMFVSNKDLALRVLEDRTKAKLCVDGAVVEHEPHVAGPANTKTDIPLSLDYIDINIKGFEDYLSELRASIAYQKSLTPIYKLGEIDRVESYDKDMLDFVKNETAHDFIIDYLTKPGLILDPNLLGRYETVGRFASSLDKGSGVVDKRILASRTQVAGQNIADHLSFVMSNDFIRRKLENDAEIAKRTPPSESELPLLRVIRDVIGSYNKVVPQETIVEEYAKKACRPFDDVIFRVKEDLDTIKALGMLREVNPRRYAWTQWFEHSARWR